MAKQRSIGQIVDEVADQYFASGMDAYTAGVKACIDVAKAQVDLLNQLSKFMQRFFDGLSGEKVPGNES